ncbi:substrate-binding domain-containing protein [Aurantimonas sp. VKM B-3413]|uniref:substrate-binding domain-containing protein n=1 Tax=Aurantimonas sp. VKM B-3413 TaxID=2779401 RepID=UPI001E2C131E|nr:substrate-binding domain-containing protein [Aurantimonas sp. VKM B-3413]MCB8838075.1 substrate-binding domain-containing protein [Aurantimonas sp. VKM B-3413]
MTDSKKNVHPNRRGVLKAGAGLGLAGLATPFILRSAFAADGLAGKTIGFSQSYGTDEWLQVQRSDVLASAKQKGLDVLDMDARDKPSQEIRNLEDLATRGVAAVIMITYYPDAIGPGIQALNDANIPIIVMSSSLNKGQKFACHLAADTYGTAQKAGAYYIDRLGAKGNCVHIKGKPGSVVSQARGNGWVEALKKQPGMKIAAEGIGNYSRSEALKLMEDFLRANRSIDAVYCHNDNMAKGALQAIEEAGREKEMFVTGFDGIAIETFKMIKEGRLAGTFVYPTFGGEAVEVTARILQGQEVPEEIVFPSPMINRQNIDEFYDAENEKRLVPKVDLEALGL